jgi:uncharacterized protein (TIGR00369 family)
MPEPVMSATEVATFLDSEFPQINRGGPFYRVESVSNGAASLRLDPDERHLRPGGTVSGPTLFALADLAAYVVVLAHIGPVALAVTTSLNINFLRKPADGEALFATGRLLKLGRRLAVIDIAIADGDDTLCAHATATYSIPPERK